MLSLLTGGTISSGGNVLDTTVQGKDVEQSSGSQELLLSLLFFFLHPQLIYQTLIHGSKMSSDTQGT